MPILSEFASVIFLEHNCCINWGIHVPVLICFPPFSLFFVFISFPVLYCASYHSVTVF